MGLRWSHLCSTMVNMELQESLHEGDELSWNARDEEVDLINLFLVLPITKMLTKISPKKIEQNKGGDNIVAFKTKNDKVDSRSLNTDKQKNMILH